MYSKSRLVYYHGNPRKYLWKLTKITNKETIALLILGGLICTPGCGHDYFEECVFYFNKFPINGTEVSGYWKCSRLNVKHK